MSVREKKVSVEMHDNMGRKSHDMRRGKISTMDCNKSQYVRFKVSQRATIFIYFLISLFRMLRLITKIGWLRQDDLKHYYNLKYCKTSLWQIWRDQSLLGSLDQSSTVLLNWMKLSEAKLLMIKGGAETGALNCPKDVRRQTYNLMSVLSITINLKSSRISISRKR